MWLLGGCLAYPSVWGGSTPIPWLWYDRASGWVSVTPLPCTWPPDWECSVPLVGLMLGYGFPVIL